MPRMTFSCGHRGQGAYCHRCKQGQELAMKAKQEKDAKKAEVLKTESARLLAP